MAVWTVALKKQNERLQEAKQKWKIWLNQIQMCQMKRVHLYHTYTWVTCGILTNHFSFYFILWCWLIFNSVACDEIKLYNSHTQAQTCLCIQLNAIKSAKHQSIQCIQMNYSTHDSHELFTYGLLRSQHSLLYLIMPISMDFWTSNARHSAYTYNTVIYYMNQTILDVR